MVPSWVEHAGRVGKIPSQIRQTPRKRKHGHSSVDFQGADQRFRRCSWRPAVGRGRRLTGDTWPGSAGVLHCTWPAQVSSDEQISDPTRSFPTLCRVIHSTPVQKRIAVATNNGLSLNNFYLKYEISEGKMFRYMHKAVYKTKMRMDIVHGHCSLQQRSRDRLGNQEVAQRQHGSCSLGHLSRAPGLPGGQTSLSVCQHSKWSPSE